MSCGTKMGGGGGGKRHWEGDVDDIETLDKHPWPLCLCYVTISISTKFTSFNFTQ